MFNPSVPFYSGIQWLILFVTACMISGCAAYTVEYLSVVEGDLSKRSARVELGSAYALIRPHNEYASGTAVAPAYVPLIPISERRFSSSYYMPSGHYADFSDIGTSPKFFVVEALFVSRNSKVVVNIPSLRVVEDSKTVKPAAYWRSEAISLNVEQMQTGDQNLCKDPRRAGQQLAGGQPAMDASATVEPGGSVCLILKYPIPPVTPTPRTVFHFDLSDLRVNGKQLAEVSIAFVGKKVVGVHAIQPGP